MARKSKEKVEFDLQSILSNPTDTKTLQGFIDEAVICRQRKQMESEAEADIKNEAKDKLGIPAGMFAYLVKTRFKDSIKADKEKVEAGEEVLDRIYGITSEE